MNFFKQLTLSLACLSLTSCALQDKPISVGPRHEHYDILSTQKVHQAQVGEAVFKEGELSIVEGIKLLTPIVAKSKHLLAPRFTLNRGTTLIKSHSKGKYYYYSAKPERTFKNALNITLSDVLVGGRNIDSFGFKQLANTQEFMLFANSEHKEYVYPMPPSAKWEKIELHDRAYAGHENSLLYLGKNHNKLVFRHTIYNNSPAKKKLFFSETKSERTENTIEIPETQKILIIQDKKMEIIEANHQMIRFILK